MKTPIISVVIPCRNEARYIRATIESVLRQSSALKDMEIIVIDGMSTDATREIVGSIQIQNPNVCLLENPRQIVSTALNIGLRRARGDIIILVGGHCELKTDYIAQCVNTLQCREDVAVVGGMIESVGASVIAKAIAVGMSSPFGVGGVAFRTGKQEEALVDTVVFGAYRRDAIEEAGLFDEELVRDQDDEYNYRIRKMGGKILFVPSIRARYYSRGTLQSLWCQYFQYGFWKVRVLQKHQRQMKQRQFVPPVFVLALVLGLLASFFSFWGLLALGLVAGSYLLANLGASIWTASKRGWSALPLLPPIFAILHLSYGLGFLVGLVKFRDRWGDKTSKVPV